MNAAHGWLVVAALLATACSDFRHGPLGGNDGQPPADAVDETDDVADGVQPDIPVGGCGSGPGACNVLTQGGCSGGQSCALIPGSNDAGVTSICEVPGSGAYGAPCTAPDACQSGLQCIGGQCRAICCSSMGTCAGSGAPGAARCGYDFGGGAFGVALCTLPCDWNAQNCPGSMTCLPLSADGTTDCFATGSVGEGSRCQRQSDCARGLLCAVTSSGATSGTCRRVCDPTRSSMCSSFQSCVHVDMTPATFGVCA